MIRFDRVSMWDFMSHAETDLELSNRGLVLVRGSNGSGKSTCVIDALCWALFGKTAGRKLEGDQVIRTGKSACSVTVTGSKGDCAFQIVRRRGPAQLELFLGSPLLNQSGPTIKATQEKIEDFLGLDHRSFTATVLFPQGALGLASMSQAEQREVLGRILDLERFEEAYERLKDTRCELSDALEANEERLRELSTKLQTEKDQVVRLLKSKAFFEDEQARYVASLKEQLAKKVKPKVKSKVLKDLKQLEKLDLSHANQALLAEQALHDRRIQQELTQIARARAVYQTSATAHKKPVEPLEPVCPTCDQPLPGESLEKLQNDYIEALRQWEKAQEINRAEIDRLAEKERSLLASQALHDRVVTEKAKEIQSQLQKLQELRKEARSLEVYQIECAAFKQKIDYEAGRVWGSEGALIDTQASIARLDQEIPEVTATIEKQKAELQYYDFWHEGFGATGVRHFYLASLTPYLSDRANYYLGQLTGGKGSISITTQRETKKGTLSDELTIEADLGQGTLYEAKSGGEKKRISIALLLALAELMATRARVKVDLCVLDEPVESIDADGAAQVVQLLRDELLKFKSSIFFISHHPDLLAEFENVITIENIGGVSKVIE